MIDEREGNGIQNGLVSNFSLKQANRGWLGKNGIYDSILPGFRLLFFFAFFLFDLQLISAIFPISAIEERKLSTRVRHN